MGLFSFKKAKPTNVSIPSDILADVNVNGAKKVSANEIGVPANLPVQPSSTSPFLKSKTASVPESAPQVATAPVPDIPAATPPTAPSFPAESTPKPFQFADQTPPPSGVRFNETPPSVAVPPVAPPVASTPTRPDFSQITQDQALVKKENTKTLAPLKLNKSIQTQKPEKKPFWSMANILSVVVFILILGLISGGSWYYLNTRSVQEELPEASIEELQPTLVEEVATESATVMVDQPNYITIDVETITLEQIKILLAEEHEKMVAEGVTTPVEYLVVDKNNNPVAFSRFALLIGAETPNDLVAASLEPFSLYLFVDQGAPRMALAITLKAETSSSFPANKTVLSQSLKKFFYPSEYQATDLSTFPFAQTTHKNNTIHYTNVDEAKNLSLDMTTEEGTLTVANSKNTLRAVIDKRIVIPNE